MSIALLTITLAGCARGVVLIPSNRAVAVLEPGESYLATNRVWIVPEARMQELIHGGIEKTRDE